MAKGRKRRTAQREKPRGGKRTARGGDPGSTETETPVWAFHRVDWESKWGLTPDRFGAKELKVMGNFESMTWAQIKGAAGGRSQRTGGTNSHTLQPEALSDDARNRLLKRYEDVEEVFSLRLGNLKRLIGVRSGRVLEILWYDDNHSVTQTTR